MNICCFACPVGFDPRFGYDEDDIVTAPFYDDDNNGRVDDDDNNEQGRDDDDDNNNGLETYSFISYFDIRSSSSTTLSSSITLGILSLLFTLYF